MHVALITEFQLNERHGTGAQLLKLYQAIGLPFKHYHMCVGPYGKSTVSHSIRLNLPKLAIPRGERLINRLLFKIGFGWVDRERVNESKLKRVFTSHPHDVVHVVVGHDANAFYASRIVAHLERPYVVHVMDLYHPNGLNSDMHGWNSLLQGANQCIALTPDIAKELRKCGAHNLVELPIGCAEFAASARAPTSAFVKVAITGNLYDGGMRFLASAVPTIRERFPNLRFFYIGPAAGRLPEAILPITDSAGFVPDRVEYERLLASCHLGYLSGPDEMNCYGQFSFPSRTVDYLFAGLPVLGYVASGSAVDHILGPVKGQSYFPTRDEKALIDAIGRLGDESTAWGYANSSALAFARDQFSMERVSRQLLRSLEHAAKCES